MVVPAGRGQKKAGQGRQAGPTANPGKKGVAGRGERGRGWEGKGRLVVGQQPLVRW